MIGCVVSIESGIGVANSPFSHGNYVLSTLRILFFDETERLRDPRAEVLPPMIERGEKNER